VWLLAARPILADDSSPLGQVVVGWQLDDAFAGQMQAQTGLEHTLLFRHRPLASSLPPEVAAQSPPHLEAGPPLPDVPEVRRGAFSLNDQPYYALRFAPAGPAQPDLAVEVALLVTGITAARQRLAWAILGGIIVVTALGALLGLVLTRRIRRPLAHLTEAATRLSQGDLTSPVSVDTRVYEIVRVADALEAARLDLQLTLNDLQREKAWSSHLLESIVEGIVTLDSPGRIAFFSQGAERITGWSREAVMGRPADEVFRLADSDRVFSQLLPGLNRRTKLTVYLADGRLATLAVTAASLAPTGHPTQTAVVFRDVSEEETMHRLVGQFLANIAHEFRTPLSALAASVELLLDQSLDLSQSELRQLLTSLYLGVLGLQTLIDNLLESASIEAGRFRVWPRPTNLADLITEVTHTVQPLVAKRGQAVQVDLPPTLPLVQADPRRTAQVLINLLSNASKYSPDTAEIALTAQLGDNYVRITIADQGLGIPPELRHDLFRRFMHDRGSPDDRLAQGGAGLGLSVVKAIVEAHGGQVGVDDRPSGGAIFWFTLPCS
jgi:PAS domain S-box-containing protein